MLSSVLNGFLPFVVYNGLSMKAKKLVVVIDNAGIDCDVICESLKYWGSKNCNQYPHFICWESSSAVVNQAQLHWAWSLNPQIRLALGLKALSLTQARVYFWSLEDSSSIQNCFQLNFDVLLTKSSSNSVKIHRLLFQSETNFHDSLISQMRQHFPRLPSL